MEALSATWAVGSTLRVGLGGAVGGRAVLAEVVGRLGCRVDMDLQYSELRNVFLFEIEVIMLLSPASIHGWLDIRFMELREAR